MLVNASLNIKRVISFKYNFTEIIFLFRIRIAYFILKQKMCLHVYLSLWKRREVVEKEVLIVDGSVCSNTQYLAQK